MQYVDVAVATRAGARDTLFTYAIPPVALPDLKPGVLVEVPFQKNFVTGVVVRLRKDLWSRAIRTRLRPLKRLLAPWPILGPQELRLRLLLAERTLAPRQLTLTAVLPPRSIMKNLSQPLPEERRALERPTLVIGGRAARMNDTLDALPEELAHGPIVLLAPTKQAVADWEQAILARYPHLPVVPFDPGGSVAHQQAVWDSVFHGTPRLILGTRSTVLLPFRRLRLLVIDQPEHRHFQEEQHPKYRVSQVAILRTTLFGTPVIFGDTLPPLHLLIPSARPRWHVRQLVEPLPKLHLLHHSPALLTPTTEATITRAQALGQQTIMVVSQPGWAVGLVCDNCGTIARCPVCGHLWRPEIGTHHRCTTCQTPVPQPLVCTVCRQARLKTFGRGQQQWQTLFKSRYPHWTNLVTVTPEELAEGTLSAALVVVLQPERFLKANDYRATERWLRLLLELRSRAKKHLLIETTIPDSPVLADLAHPFPKESLVRELALRRHYGYPPFGHLFRLEMPSDGHTPVPKHLLQMAQNITLVFPKAVTFGPSREVAAQSVWRISIKLPAPLGSKDLAALRQLVPPHVRWELDP